MAKEQAQPHENGEARTGPFEFFPMRLLGFGLFLAWSALAIPLEQSLGVAALSSPIFRLFVISALNAGGCIAVAWFVRITGKDPWSRKALAGCAAIGALFPFLECAAIRTSLLAFDLCAIAAQSIVSVGVFLMWNVQIAARKPRIAWVAYAGSMALAACVYFVVQGLGEPVLFVASAALPAISCAFLALSARLPQGSPPSADENAGASPEDVDPCDEEVDWKMPWSPVLVILAFAFAYGLVVHYEGDAHVPVELGRLIAAGGILLGVSFAFSRFDENVIAKAASISMVAALLLCGTEGLRDSFGIGKLLASVGYYGVMIYVYFALSVICFRYKARVEWLFGIVGAMYYLMTPPSALFGDWLREAEGSAALSIVDVSANLTVVLIVALSLFLFVKDTFTNTWGIKALRAASSENGGRAESTAARDYLKDRVYCCAMIARQYGLTHREEEVLSLIAERKSFAEIEAALYIAHGTLRVHVQHLYDKLDLHSKKEVCDFVDAWHEKETSR